MPSIRGDVAYNYRRASVLEGTFPRDAGYFIVTACRVYFGWGGIAPEDWPNATYGIAPEPPGLDEIAKRNRISGYWRIDNLDEARRCLSLGPFGAAFAATHEWFYARDGHIDTPPISAPIIGTHVVTLNGYSTDDGTINFVNSWGPAWGVNGSGTMSFRFFETQLREAWRMLPGDSIVENRTGLMRLENGYHTPLGIMHVVQVYDADRDDRMGWAILLERETCLEIQDLFVKPQHRNKGIARSLVADIVRIRRERVKRSLPLRSLVYPIDVERAPDAARKVAKLLGLELTDANVPWARYLARPTRTVWKSHSRKKRS